MKVTLRKKHINKGLCQEPEFCPIALALKEKTHKPVEVNSSNDITIGNTMYIVSNTKLAARVDHFICKFDNGLKGWLKPFTFEVVPA